MSGITALFLPQPKQMSAFSTQLTGHVQLSASSPQLDLRIEPNHSLGDQGFVLLLALALIVPLIAGGAFASLGAWMVLPFAGFEALVLVAVAIANRQRSRYFERIFSEGGLLRVEVTDQRGKRNFVWNRAWVNVEERASGLEHHVYVRAHGRILEVGCHRDADGRRALANQLRQHLNCCV